MAERPVLNKDLDSKTFREFYYLKEELVNFCRENGLQGNNRYEKSDLIVLENH